PPDPRDEETTFAGSPPASTTAPSANVSSRSLGSSTKKAPRTPCGRPTRPTATSSEPTIGELGYGFLARCEWRAHARGPRSLRHEIEAPVGAGLVLVRHPDAAGVDDSDAGDDAFELCVRVATHHDRHIEALEEERDALVGGTLGEDVDVVPRRSVAIEDVAD